VGSREITIRDVLQAADFRGELDAAWAEACWLAEREELDVDEDAIQAASEQFRTDRDLITAEETEQWLDQRGLTLDEFCDYLVRHYGKEELQPKAGPPATKYAQGPEAMQDFLRIDLLLGGEFDRLAEGLAWRLAVKEDGLADMAGLEAAYREASAGLLTERMREQALGALRLTLTSLELEVLELESQNAAREALFCLREDGESMADVARDGRYPLHRYERRFGEMPAEVQPKLMSALAGEVIGPFNRGDGVVLYRLLRKTEPLLTDEAVKARVDQYLIERHFSELAAKSIHWVIAPSRSYAEAH
jgi:hypothetical protein